jgi:hypothetical protein
VDDQNNHDHDCRDRNDREPETSIRVRLEFVRCSRDGERCAENADQRYAPKVC